MAEITITTPLSDWIIELNDLMSTFIQLEQDNVDRLSIAEADIDDLQSPVPGVPPSLLAWLATHSITEVDPTLGTTISGLQTDLSQAQDDIDIVESGLAQEITDRITADTTLQTNIDIVSNTASDILNSLLAETIARASSESNISAQLDDVNVRIDDVEGQVTTEVTNRTTDTTSLFQAVDVINNNLNTNNAKILLLQGTGVDPEGALAAQVLDAGTDAADALAGLETEIDDRIAADTALQGSVNNLSNTVSGHTISIAAETAARISSDNSTNATVGSLSTLVNSHTASITAETAARIASDDVLTAGVSGNTSDIVTLTSSLSAETTARINADTTLTTNVGTNTADILSLTTTSDEHTLQIGSIELKYSLVIDGSGYITGFLDIAETETVSKFFVKDLNNNVRLQNPLYPGKFFPSVSVASFSLPASYDADWGGGVSNTFHGTDGFDYTRNVKIYSPATVAINGSIFEGANYGTGGSQNRIGQANTTFLVSIDGTVNKNLSLWYRIKDLPGDTTGTWYPVCLASINHPSPGTYERTSRSAAVVISVNVTKVIEFGLTLLSTVDATMSDTSKDFLYDGNVGIQAFNVTTIS